MNKTTLLTALDKNNEFNAIPATTFRQIFSNKNKLYVPINKIIMSCSDDNVFEIYNPSDLGDSTLYLLFDNNADAPDFTIKLANADKTLLDSYSLDNASLLFYFNKDVHYFPLRISEETDTDIYFVPNKLDPGPLLSARKTRSMFGDMVVEGTLIINLYQGEEQGVEE